MQKHLERCYSSSRFVLQVTDPELGDQCFLQHIVSRSALWPKGDNASSFKAAHYKHFWEIAWIKRESDLPFSAHPVRPAGVDVSPSGGLTSQQKHDAWRFRKHCISETCGSFQTLTCCFKQYQKSHSLISLISSEKSSCVEKLWNSQWKVHVTQFSNFHLRV